MLNYNKKYVVFGITLLVMAWVGNILYYNAHVLKEPLFLKHYYVLKQGMYHTELYYIDNINSKDKVVSINFPELASRPIDFTESSWNSDHRYYQMKRLDITFYRGDANAIPPEYRNKLITKAQICFVSGKIIEADIGKLYLYSDEPAKEFLKTSTVMGSSDNITKATFMVDKDLTISGIGCQFPELVQDILKPEINGKAVSNITFPMSLKAGDKLELSSSFEFDKSDIRKNYIYNFPIEVLAKDKYGKESGSSLYVNYWLQFPGQYYIKELIKEGSAGKHV